MAMETLPLLNLPDGVSIWTAHDLDNVKRRTLKGNPDDDAFKQGLFSTINTLGARSQLSQNLVVPLTTVSRLHENSSYTLYLLIHEGRGVGILKVGLKKLFLTHPATRRMVEVEPTCVLDFYVDESCQRRGFGKHLFSTMIERENIDPGRIAIDRPGPKFLSFLDKHYGLRSYSPQANNYVVFDSFFDGTYVTERGMLRWGTPPLSNQDSIYGSAMGFSTRKNYHPSAHTLFDFEDDDFTRKHSLTGRSALGRFDPYYGLPTTNVTYGLPMRHRSFLRRNSFHRQIPSTYSQASGFSTRPLSRLSLATLSRAPSVAPMMIPLTARTSQTDALSARLSRRLSLLSSSSGGSSRSPVVEGSTLWDWPHHLPLSRRWSLRDDREPSEPQGGWTIPARRTPSGRYIPTESGVAYDIITGVPL
ncbi:unnamed protein product [Phytomonas sp. Hart1]|nr:unnamed protein product [Phytomonas sp. Hart1]|eukprot:CCW70922.1 unnamed protein product [Phytomonas sp. isolate Hart1]